MRGIKLNESASKQTPSDGSIKNFFLFPISSSLSTLLIINRLRHLLAARVRFVLFQIFNFFNLINLEKCASAMMMMMIRYWNEFLLTPTAIPHTHTHTRFSLMLLINNFFSFTVLLVSKGRKLQQAKPLSLR